MKIQSQAMFYDTSPSFNRPRTVLSNIHQAFVEAATKLYHYANCLAKRRSGPKPNLVIRTSLIYYD